MTISYYRI